MARLKDIFGLNRSQDQDLPEMVADEVRESKGPFEVPVVDHDTGAVRTVLRFASAEAFAQDINVMMMKGNEEYFDLSGKDLSGIDFSETHELYGAKFDDSNLTGTKFKRCDLTGSSFKNCIMHDVDMEEAIIRYADFSHADLKGAFMELAKANRTKFTHAKAVGAFMGNMAAVDTDFMQADLTNAVTDGMDVKGANMQFAKLTKQQLNTCKNADKAQVMTASYLMRKSGRKGGNKPS